MIQARYSPGIISTLFRSIFCSRFAFSLLSWLIYMSVVPVSPHRRLFQSKLVNFFLWRLPLPSCILGFSRQVEYPVLYFILHLFMSVSYNRSFPFYFLLLPLSAFPSPSVPPCIPLADSVPRLSCIPKALFHLLRYQVCRFR